MESLTTQLPLLVPCDNLCILGLPNHNHVDESTQMRTRPLLVLAHAASGWRFKHMSRKGDWQIDLGLTAASITELENSRSALVPTRLQLTQIGNAPPQFNQAQPTAGVLHSTIKTTKHVDLSVHLINHTRPFTPKDQENFSQVLPHLARAFDNSLHVDHCEETFIGQVQAQNLTHYLPAFTSADSFNLDQTLVPLIPQPDTPIKTKINLWLEDALNQLNHGQLSTKHLTLKINCGFLTAQLVRDWQQTYYRLQFKFSNEIAHSFADPLTHKQREILLWLHHGKSKREIAEIMKISLETVKTHLKLIFSKLGVSNRIDAVATTYYQSRSPKQNRLHSPPQALPQLAPSCLAQSEATE